LLRAILRNVAQLDDWGMAMKRSGKKRERLVDESIVAEHLGTGVRFLQADRAGAQLIPFYRIGRQIRYRLSEVDDALAHACRTEGMRTRNSEPEAQRERAA
jgi:hypothetical protein